MTTILTVKPGPTHYHTREQLYALCVLLCWSEGLNLNNNIGNEQTVNLIGVTGGNTGVSVFNLQNNPNAADVRMSNSPNESHTPIYFKVLGVELVVQFDEDGVGVVAFADQEEALSFGY